MSTTKNKKYGFSLLELLAVMSIMGLLTTLAVTSYFSAARGMARRSAVKHLANSLILARQRACMDNARVSVVLYNEVAGDVDDGSGGTKRAVIPSYVVCKEVGKISMRSGSFLIDEFNSLDTMFSTVAMDGGDNYAGGFRLYNLSVGGFSFVYPWVVPSGTMLQGRASPYKARGNTTINAWCFKINANVPARQKGDIWNVGDSYGVEAAPIQTLPQKFQIRELSDSRQTIVVVTFLPDGRAQRAESITLEESQTARTTKVVVTQNGEIKFDNKW